MRVYGRELNQDGTYTWVVITTDENGYNDAVYLTALVQCLKLNLNESPFYADAGIPAQPSVVQQLFPDFCVALIQQRFAPYFASLIISKVDSPTPTYRVNVLTNSGSKRIIDIPA